MIDENFSENDLSNLKKLQIDLEKQMLKFDEIIPYEKQVVSHIFSPRLLNMLLACGPQIEAITKLIASKANLEMQLSIPNLIQKINENGLLSKFEIVLIESEIQFTPFTKDLEWWKIYNNLKHGLARNHHQINYTIIMDALAALAALHYFAEKLMIAFDKNISDLFNEKNWISDENMISIITFTKDTHPRNPFWHSLLFEIRTLYHVR